MGNAFGLFAGIAWGLSDYLAAHLSKRFHPIATLLVGQLTTAPLVLLMMLVIPSGFSLDAAAWGAVGGVGNVLGMLMFLRAFAIEKASVVAPLCGVFSCVPPVVFGLVTGDRLTVLLALGAVLCLAGVVLVTSASPEPVPTAPGDPVSAEDLGRRHPLEGAFLATGAGFTFGLMFLCLAAAPEESGLWPLLMMRSSALLPLGYVVVRSVPLNMTARTVRSIFLRFSVALAALGSYRLGVRDGSVVIVTILSSISPLFTAVLAWWIDKEAATRW
ncbi:MAG TPA: DMT family transporter, partial [Propionibacteriaceae bacterium]